MPASPAERKRAKVARVVAQLTEELDHPDRTVPPYRHPDAIAHQRSPHPAITERQPPVTRAAARISAVFHIRFHGGDWLAPPGERDGGGGGVVRFTGGSRVCWSFSRTSGLDRPRVIELFRGTVAPGTSRVESPVMLLGSWAPSGCVSGTDANELVVIDHHPADYLIGISDAVDEIALGGQL